MDFVCISIVKSPIYVLKKYFLFQSLAIVIHVWCYEFFFLYNTHSLYFQCIPDIFGNVSEKTMITYLQYYLPIIVYVPITFNTFHSISRYVKNDPISYLKLPTNIDILYILILICYIFQIKIYFNLLNYCEGSCNVQNNSQHIWSRWIFLATSKVG